MAQALSERGIHADCDGLHLLPPDQLQQSAALQDECKEFLSKTKQFNEIVQDFITVMESKSKVIEGEKLKRRPSVSATASTLRRRCASGSSLRCRPSSTRRRPSSRD